MKENKKVLVICLDGATWDLIKPLVDNGELPTFKKLMEEGTLGELESTIPPWTIPAWESMATGKNPGKLGYASFMVKEGRQFTPHVFKHKRQEMIWDYLSEKGYKAIVANAPNIYSAQEINGCMISGWLCLDENKLTYPNSLIGELSKCCDGYKKDIFDIDFSKGKITQRPKESEYLRKCDELLENHSCVFKYLLSNYKFDFGVISFVTPDRVQHKFYDEGTLTKHYKKIDKKLEEILDMLHDETTVLLVSDHGFGPVNYVLKINELLLKRGYLVLRKNKQDIKRTLALKLSRRSKLSSLARTGVEFLPNLLAKKLRRTVSPLSYENMDIDWNETKAFAYGVWGDIYLNKDKLGISEYHRIREEIIEIVKNIKFKEKVLKTQIFKKEEIYPNAAFNDDLPDLVVVPTDEGVQRVDPNVGIGKIITELNTKVGGHRLNGIFLARGPDIKKGAKIENAKIYDIAPTILRMFGVPIPKDIDGRVLMEVFKEDSELAKKRNSIPRSDEKEN